MDLASKPSRQPCFGFGRLTGRELNGRNPWPRECQEGCDAGLRKTLALNDGGGRRPNAGKEER